MKKLFYTFLFISLSFITLAQKTHVNREWKDYTGNPVFNPLLNPFGLEWTKSIVTATNDIITVAHTNVSGQGENILLSRYTEDGSLLWQTDYNTSGTQNDYGIDVAEDSNGDIYVCGTTDNGGNTDYDVLLLKYDNTGSLLWAISYSGPDGLNDIGTAIKINGSGDVYVAASNENNSTSYDYLVIKYDNSGSLLWSNTYDYANLIDVPVGIIVRGGSVLVAGASANSLTDWDYAVADFNETTGSYNGDARSNISGIGYDQPLAFKKDATGNTYLTGKASTNGINYDIRTVKISPTNAIVWTQTFDAYGLEDVGNTIAIDNNGDVIVGGYITKTNNKKDLICLKYSSNGSLLWQHNQPSKDGNADAYIQAITLNTTNNNIYFIAGEKGIGTNKEALIGKIKSNGDKGWEKSIKGNYDYLPSDIQYGGFGSPGIYTIAIKDSTVDVYETAYYTELETDTAMIYHSSGLPSFKKHELIIRFQPSAINTAAVDNQVGTKEMEFGDLSEFLTSSAYGTFTNSLRSYCDGDCDIKAIKIFKQIPTTYTATTSRLGQTIRVPDFWSALLVVLPSNITIANAHAAFETIPTVVGYSHPNYIAQLHSPNDSIYPQQISLHTNTLYPNANINVEEAWSIIPKGGSPFVRGGVFDSGVYWIHKDFGHNGVNASSSKIIDGWDFATSQPMKSTSGNDVDNHGTRVAGVIGAVRNNIKGVAGIAGGNDSAGVNLSTKGISLYSLRVAGFNVIPPIYNGYGLATDIAEAIRTSSIKDSLLNYGYGLHFMNNSWGFNPSDQFYQDTNIVLVSEAVHFANRQNVTFVASRGNLFVGDLNQISYPSCIDDDWVLSVGGTGENGNYCHANNAYDPSSPNCSLSSFFGYGMDLAAPASTATIKSTSNGQGYFSFGATSAAAPHVSGVVGLLMSYMNDTTGNANYKNLAPEDCEFIIQKSATDVDSVGYDVLTGHGRLNAGKAMRMVEKPYRALYHFGTGNSSYSITKTLYSNSDTIKLTERYQNKASVPVWFKKGKYVVKTYQINATVNHLLPFATDSLMYYWPRPSNSAVLELFNGNKYLSPRERVIINSCNSSSASMKGYIYQVKDTLGNALGWWPCDTSLSCSTLGNLFDYSILVKNKGVGIKENNGDLSQNINLYPNPASHQQKLIVNTETSETITVELYDLMGRLIKSVYVGKTTIGETVIENNVAGLANSMYIYLIKVGDKSCHKRFIKQ